MLIREGEIQSAAAKTSVLQPLQKQKGTQWATCDKAGRPNAFLFYITNKTYRLRGISGVCGLKPLPKSRGRYCFYIAAGCGTGLSFKRGIEKMTMSIGNLSLHHVVFCCPIFKSYIGHMAQSVNNTIHMLLKNKNAA